MEKNESKKLKALSDIASIDITLELDNILLEILKTTCETMNAHSGTMMLVDEDSNELKMVSSYGLPEDYIERVYKAARKAGLPISSSPSGDVLRTGNPYPVPDIFKEPKDRPWFELARQIGFSAQLFTPISQGLKVIGLLNIYMEKVHDFTEEEINFVTIAASQASSVVQNARMCMKLEGKIRETHEALFYSEARYRELFENAQDPMYTHDMKGFFRSINKAGLEQLGCTENEEVIGTHISRWLAPESYKLVEERFRKIYFGEPLDQPVIIEVICKNGTHRWGEVRTSLIRHENQVIGTHGIARDITEKKKLEQHLRESEVKYRELFENAQEAMYTIDMNGTFLAMNNVGLNALRVRKDEIIGTNLSEWLTPESMETARHRLSEFAKGIQLGPMVYEIVRKDGEHIWIEVNNRYIMEGGKITGIHGIARDITEKKRLEQKIKDYHAKLEKSYEELLEADRIKTEFMSNITHELLTPLTSIKGFVELIDDETMGKINAEQKKSLEIIKRNSERLIRLIKELLDTSNLENNKLGLQFRLVSVNSILSRTIQDIHPQANDKQITIIKDIQQIPEIWGDEERLVQVLTNLLINAIKFTPHEGKITIRAAEDIEHVKISISDTGIGIPADKLKNIFDRFYQIDGSASRKYGGVGLGLSICKSIIDRHFGTIWAESNGHGSTFHIVLPKLRYDPGENNV